MEIEKTNPEPVIAATLKVTELELRAIREALAKMSEPDYSRSNVGKAGYEVYSAIVDAE